MPRNILPAFGAGVLSALILALMLTILTLGYQVDRKLDTSFYERIQRLAYLDTIVFIAASVLLLLVSIPILEESDAFSSTVYQAYYYVMLIYTAALGGTLIVVVMMLLNAIRAVIHLLHPERDDDLTGELESL